MDIKELKAKAYDLLVQQQQIQAKLAKVNQEIAEKIQEDKKE